MATKIRRIIPMHSNRKTIQTPVLTPAYLAQSAYAFAYAILWDGQAVSHKEAHFCIAILDDYFKECKNLRQGFIVFCEQVQMAHRSKQRAPIYSTLLSPSEWFTHLYSKDQSHWQSWYSELLRMRTKIPELLKGHALLAHLYLDYIEKPTPGTFHKGHKRLMKSNASHALNCYYKVVVYYNYEPF